jgi:hypothetical protein
MRQALASAWRVPDEVVPFVWKRTCPPPKWVRKLGEGVLLGGHQVSRGGVYQEPLGSARKALLSARAV